LIDIRGLKLSFGERVLLGSVDWRISDRERVGLIGDNGAGKTTLLRLLSGEAEPDRGVIERSKNLTVGYLPQDLVELEGIPVIEYLRRKIGLAETEDRLRGVEHDMSEAGQEEKKEKTGKKNLSALLAEHSRLERRFELLGGFEFEASARKVLQGLGFSVNDAERSCLEFSGGWKMRITLAALLLSRPDVLLLDEPTNHLDTESMEWLESWLRAYEGAVVAVSHDRRFLDNMMNGIAELARGKLTVYPWSYERYLVEKEFARERLEKTIQEQHDRVEKIERFITRFRYKASKATQVQSRIKQLEKMDVYELDGLSKTVHFRIPEAPDSGWNTLSAENLSKRYGDNSVFENVAFSLTRGERAVLVGVNGAGKSTLLRLLSGVEEPTIGSVRMGHNVKRAFYSQESAQNVNYSRTVWEEARETPSKMNEQGKRNLLGAFLFSGDDIQKPVSVLSGGEKSRLALFKLMLAESNFLILDEPTNHLDMNTKELFQKALLQYGGTLLIVSHDRHFLDELAERVLEIRQGRLFDYPGNYSWFLEKRESMEHGSDEVKNKKDAVGQRAKNEKSEREAQEKQDRRALKKEIASMEACIEKGERRRDEVDALLCAPDTLSDSSRVQALMKERSELERNIADDYAKWEEMMSKWG